MDKIKEQVANFKTKNKEGFIQSEIDTLLNNYPNINKDKFNKALMSTTCILKNDEMVVYHNDIEKALRHGTENRDYLNLEWD